MCMRVHACACVCTCVHVRARACLQLGQVGDRDRATSCAVDEEFGRESEAADVLLLLSLREGSRDEASHDAAAVVAVGERVERDAPLGEDRNVLAVELDGFDRAEGSK